MCRFTLYLGPPVRLSTLLVEPAHSLIHQSYHALERSEPLNGDGFGVGWYAPTLERTPGLFRSVSPAWNNRNLTSLARVVTSPCVLAHVRAATVGMEVSESNCHPFGHGCWLFMHNGTIGGFRRLRRALLEGLTDDAFDVVRGSTDTEHLFAVFVDELVRNGWFEERAGEGGEGDGPSTMAVCLNRAVFRVLELVRAWGDGVPSYLNLAVADGTRAAVCRFTDAAIRRPESLYYTEEGLYPPAAADSPGRRRYERARCVVVASERLTDDAGWTEVPPNHLLDLSHDAAPGVWSMHPDGLHVTREAVRA